MPFLMSLVFAMCVAWVWVSDVARYLSSVRHPNAIASHNERSPVEKVTKSTVSSILGPFMLHGTMTKHPRALPCPQIPQKTPRPSADAPVTTPICAHHVQFLPQDVCPSPTKHGAPPFTSTLVATLSGGSNQVARPGALDAIQGRFTQDTEHGLVLGPHCIFMDPNRIPSRHTTTKRRHSCLRNVLKAKAPK